MSAITRRGFFAAFAGVVAALTAWRPKSKRLPIRYGRRSRLVFYPETHAGTYEPKGGPILPIRDIHVDASPDAIARVDAMVRNAAVSGRTER